MTKIFEMTIYGASGHGVIRRDIFTEEGLELLFPLDEPLLAEAVAAITIKPHRSLSVKDREVERLAIIRKLKR